MPSLARSNITPPVPFPVDNYSTGAAITLNVSAQTVVKALPGRVVRIDVTVPGSGAGSVNDVATNRDAGRGRRLRPLESIAELAGEAAMAFG
jgi:hypothetical protein